MAGYQRTLCFHTLAMLIALTAAVQMELKLEQTWDRLVSVLQSISEGLIFIDNKGIVSQMNTCLLYTSFFKNSTIIDYI